MYSTFFLDKSSGKRISAGQFKVSSHHAALAEMKKKHQKIFEKFETGQWRVVTHNEETKEEQEFKTL